MKRALCMIALGAALLTCGPNNPQQSTLIASDVSPCGGFASLSKSAAMPFNWDSSDYCEAEKLRWSFDDGSHELDIVHTRMLQNCGARLCIQARGVAIGVEIIEKDTSTMPMDCMCYFDTYYKIQNSSGNTMTIIIYGRSFAIDLKKRTGVIVLDASQNWPCSYKGKSIFSYYDFRNIAMIQVQEYDSLCSSHFFVKRAITDQDTIAALLHLLKQLPSDGDIMVKWAGNAAFQKAIFIESDSKIYSIDIIGKRIKTPKTSFYLPEKDAEKKFVQGLLAE
jgi:hypothetical protein